MSHLGPTQLRKLLLQPNLFKASLFTPSQEVPISFKSLFMTSSHPRWGRPAFRVAPNSWPKRTIFGNLSSFIRRMWLSYLNLSFIIEPESWIEPYFSYNLLFEIRSVSRVPRTICSQFLWKTSSKFSFDFWSAQASEPYLTTVITVAFNITILFWRLIFLFFWTFFSCEKNTLSLSYSTFDIFTAPTVFTNNTTKASEAADLINLFVTQRHLVIFIYS